MGVKKEVTEFVLEGNIEIERVRPHAGAVDDDKLPFRIGKGNDHLAAGEHPEGFVIPYENDFRSDAEFPLEQLRKLFLHRGGESYYFLCHI